MNNEFIERFIFEQEKDLPIKNKESFYKKLKDRYNLDEMRDLYIKIINYQIDTYGESLANSELIDPRSYDECKRRAKNSRKRKYYRRNRKQ